MTFRRWLHSQRHRADHIGELANALTGAPASAPTRRIPLTVDRLREHAEAIEVPVWQVYAAAGEFERQRANR